MDEYQFSIFDDQKIKEFMEETNLEESELISYISELIIYAKDPNNFNLVYDQGVIELISAHKTINPGIEYLDENYFNNAITIRDIDYKKNPQKMQFIKNVTQDNHNYFLTGSNGIGKTFLVIALANLKYEKTKEKTLYVFWPDFIEKTKNFNNNNGYVINRVKYAKSLIIDDLGQESVSQWSRDDILNSVIAFRLSKNLDTYITSNYNYDELRELYTLKKIEAKKARSIISKIAGLCNFYALEGEDLRNR